MEKTLNLLGAVTTCPGCGVKVKVGLKMVLTNVKKLSGIIIPVKCTKCGRKFNIIIQKVKTKKQ